MVGGFTKAEIILRTSEIAAMQLEAAELAWDQAAQAAAEESQQLERGKAAQLAWDRAAQGGAAHINSTGSSEAAQLAGDGAAQEESAEV